MTRKTPCAPILDHQDDGSVNPKNDCRFCGRGFASYNSMRRHVRNNCKIAPTERNGGAGMKQLYDHIIRKKNAELEALKAQVVQMSTHLLQAGQGADESAQGGAPVFIDNRKQILAVDNRKIIINVFGQEGVDHASMDRIKDILDESLKVAALPEAARAAVLRTAQLIYSDPAHPENLTCFLPNKKTDDALVHGSGGWEVQSVSLVLPPMAQKSVDTLFAQQPYENAEAYGGLLKELAETEAKHAGSADLRPVLIRNKAVLAATLGTPPRAGEYSTPIEMREEVGN
jgi:hypothetical protein